MENSKICEDKRSGRNFFKNTGAISLGLDGLASEVISCQADSNTADQTVKNRGKLFVGNPLSLQDRIERVLIATIGMQRCDCEQGTVVQALLEMGEHDLVVSFARATIMRQVEGRISVIKGNIFPIAPR